MICNRSLFKILAITLTLQVTAAFFTTPVGQQQFQRTPAVCLRLVQPSEEDTTVATNKMERHSMRPMGEKIGQLATTVAVVLATSPWMALAEEAEEYEYGSVNAPIGIAWAGGVLAILTAFLPVALRGGEEAFEEMKERDSGKWGTGDSSSLNKKRK